MEYDSPWKTILDHLLYHCLQMINHDLFNDIDWTVDPIFLDKELNKIAPKHKVGNRFVDKLFQIQMKNGETKWVLLHIEVQVSYDSGFPERMFIYNYRIYDKYQQRVISMAIMADLDDVWRPDSFSYGGYGSNMSLNYKVVKLIDYEEEKLIQSENPFAIVILAHLNAIKNAGDDETQQTTRARAKKNLLRMALTRNYSRDQIRHLTLFIDWVMNVPEDLDNQLKEDLHNEVGEKKMQYITGWERRAKKAGRREGMLEGERKGMLEGERKGKLEGRREGKLEGRREGKLEGRREGRREGKLEGRRDMFLRMVNRKFGVVPDWALTKVNEADVKQLDRWSDLLFTDKPLEEIIKPRA
ncbi:MAG: hypothetical protein QNK37_33870 [Acidobacteriota bacterium]|nr:hypothetical protein [Acidobacteriota bacterium]